MIKNGYSVLSFSTHTNSVIPVDILFTVLVNLNKTQHTNIPTNRGLRATQLCYTHIIHYTIAYKHGQNWFNANTA